MRLTSFFALFEDAGEEPLLDRTIRERAGSEVFDALAHVGALVAAAPAPSWECGDPSAEGCVRRVVLNDVDAKRPLIAVCGNAERLCENVSLARTDVARHRASREGLERIVAKLFAIEVQASAGPHPLRKIGEQIHDGGVRDVFIAWNPGDTALSAVLALRARAARDTLVFVPTATRLPAELALLHGPGDRVEIVSLADALRVEDRAIVRLARSTQSPASNEAEADIAAPLPKSPPANSALRLPRPRVWQELRVYLIDGHTVSVRGVDAHARCTYLDLGMASQKSRQPSVIWGLFILFCEGNGAYRWKPPGNFDVVKRRIAYLRAALSSTFGLEEDPFEKFTRRAGWQTKFKAFAELPEDE